MHLCSGHFCAVKEVCVIAQTTRLSWSVLHQLRIIMQPCELIVCGDQTGYVAILLYVLGMIVTAVQLGNQYHHLQTSSLLATADLISQNCLHQSQN